MTNICLSDCLGVCYEKPLKKTDIMTVFFKNSLTIILA